jgi:hypothetical protein
MTINLENYLNKEVEVELHNGKIVKGVIAKYGQNGKIMYQIAGRYFGYGTYGQHYFRQDFDIMNIKEITQTKQMDQQTYITTLEVNVLHTKDDFGYTLSADEYGTVTISHMEGMEAMTGTTNHIHIPKDGIQHIIDALVKFQ